MSWQYAIQIFPRVGCHPVSIIATVYRVGWCQDDSAGGESGSGHIRSSAQHHGSVSVERQRGRDVAASPDPGRPHDRLPQLQAAAGTARHVRRGVRDRPVGDAVGRARRVWNSSRWSTTADAAGTRLPAAVSDRSSVFAF